MNLSTARLQIGLHLRRGPAVSPQRAPLNDDPVGQGYLTFRQVEESSIRPLRQAMGELGFEALFYERSGGQEVGLWR
jgi:hypothetical protein